MREADTTTRERIAAALRERPATPSALADAFDVAPSTALDHVEHISHSLDASDETLLVRPPTCEECGFDGFDDRLNVPSRCPECKSEQVLEPAVRIDS
jgi:predicted Zn-ribbon and HTH transcriptional regulator